MSAKLPLVLYDGVVEEIHEGDTLDAQVKAAGSDGEIQYAASGALTSSSNLVWNSTTNVLTINGDITADNIGTLAAQDSNNVNITGGSITGITDLAISDGGTGASSAQAAINNLTNVGSGVDGDVLTKSDSSAIWMAPATGPRHVIKDSSGASLEDRANLKFTDGGEGVLTVTNNTTTTIVAIQTSTTAAANSIPVSDGSGKIDSDYVPEASTSAKGIVQLTNSYAGVSETLAATQKCVKDAFDNIDTSTQLLWSIVFGG